MGSIAVHRIQHKLNMLNEEIFPLLGDKGVQVEHVLFQIAQFVETLQEFVIYSRKQQCQL